MNDSTDARLEKAESLLQDGHLTSAHFELKKLLRKDPANIHALLLNAELKLQMRDRAGCLDTIDLLFNMQPDKIDGQLQKRLGHLCFANDLFHKAMQSFQRARLGGVEDAVLLLQLGIAHYHLLNTQDAERCLRACTEANPEFAPAYLHLGHVYKAQGENDAAVQNYKAYIEHSPHEKGTGYWHLADLKSYALTDDDIAAIGRAIESEPENLPQLSALQFSLGRAAERNADFATAIHHYNEGNATQAKIKPFDVALYQRIVAGLQTVTAGDQPVRSNDKPIAILIVGLPRSGTTLLEQILSSHSRVQASDELPLLEDIAWRLNAGGNYLQQLTSMSEEKKRELRLAYVDGARAYIKQDCDYFIDKNPRNFLHLGLAKRIMPESIVIDMRRDPRDVAISAYRQLFNFTYEFSTSFDGIYEYYKGYLEMIEHWRSVYPDQIKTVSYEELVYAPEAQIQSLLTYCGLECEAACLKFYDQKRTVMTPSVGQVTEPAYTSSIGQWRRYEAFVPDEMSRLGSLPTAPELRRYKA